MILTNWTSQLVSINVRSRVTHCKGFSDLAPTFANYIHCTWDVSFIINYYSQTLLKCCLPSFMAICRTISVLALVMRNHPLQFAQCIILLFFLVGTHHTKLVYGIWLKHRSEWTEMVRKLRFTIQFIFFKYKTGSQSNWWGFKNTAWLIGYVSKT